MNDTRLISLWRVRARRSVARTFLFVNDGRNRLETNATKNVYPAGESYFLLLLNLQFANNAQLIVPVSCMGPFWLRCSDF
jgi:hypothetical protein